MMFRVRTERLCAKWVSAPEGLHHSGKKGDCSIITLSKYIQMIASLPPLHR
jgi:hypothetical protein